MKTCVFVIIVIKHENKEYINICGIESPATKTKFAMLNKKNSRVNNHKESYYIKYGKVTGVSITGNYTFA